MRSKYMNSTSGHKFVTRDIYSDTNFLYNENNFSRPTLRFAYFFDLYWPYTCAVSTIILLLLRFYNLTSYFSYLNLVHPFSYRDAVVV